jgi:beta-lactamase regulating signal transducer with metallopeptidase domain
MTMLDPSTVPAIALKTSLLFAVVGLVAPLMARQSAAWRHFLWTASLALALLMPIAVVVLPTSVRIALPWQPSASWMLDDSATLTGDATRTDATSRRPGPQQGDSAVKASEARAAWPAVMIVWLIGALAVVLRNALAHVALMRWSRAARADLSPAWSATLARVTREAGLRRPLRVLESVRATSPCTWGVLRPVLMLPAAGADWPEPQRRFVLLHELAHVRRFDYLTTQVSNLACAVHWYNPLAWFAAARARKLQEQACDDAVLDAGGAPSDYAEFLLAIAGGSPRFSVAFPAAVGMAQRSQIHGRLTSILDASRARAPLRGLAIPVALVPLVCAALLLATLSATSSSAATQWDLPLTKPFDSVELRNGGDVFLSYGPEPRVRLLDGVPEESGIVVRDDGRLVIDRCSKGCSHRHDLGVEVVLPALTAIAVAEGGTIQVRDDFPPQAEISVDVSQGGTIDIRKLPVTRVTASVFSGGRIFTKPGSALSAKVEQGGAVTYWGAPAVESSIQYGGVVVLGWPEDADRPLAELGAARLPPVPPVPAVPAIPAIRGE